MADSDTHTDGNLNFSPPSSDSSNAPVASTPPTMADSDSPPTSTRGYCLVIRRQPTHLFAGEEFEVEFSLAPLDSRPNLPKDTSPPANVDIRASLETSRSEASLVVSNEPRISPSKQTGKVVARIVLNSGPRGESYFLRLDARGGVQGVTSSAIKIVEAKLYVTTPSDWSDTWYKDEGGRDKCMEVTVTAKDKESCRVRRSLPLRVDLCYDAKNDGQLIPVRNQGILRMLGSARSHGLDDQGQTKIRFRIEEVSKNHQGQNFVLRIQAKNEASVFAPCSTPTVTVRSKRNRPRPSPSHPSIDYSVETQVPGANFNNERLREAVHGVTRWSEEVVNGINPLRWQVMGYAQNPDGSLDYSRPYHNMQDPNAFITRITAIYNAETRGHLEVLRNAVEPSLSYEYEHRSSRDAYPMIPHAARGFATHHGQMGMAMPLHQAHHHQPPLTMFRASPAEFMARSEKPDMSDEELESKVEFVLAQQYKASSTGETLGFPAYSSEMQLIGFFRYSGSGTPRFSPIGMHFFSSSELQQAAGILQSCIGEKSPVVHSLKEYRGSLSRMLDHALVHHWKEEIPPSSRGRNEMM